MEHGGHILKLIEGEAKTYKTEITAMIQRQRQHLQAKKDKVTQLDEDCAELIQKEEKVKRDAKSFTEHLIRKIHAKKENIICCRGN